MTTEQKQQIVDAANIYFAEKQLTQNEASRQSGINAGYLSNMLRGNFSSSESDISDRWFFQLAKYISLPIAANYWTTVPVIQFHEVIATLEEAKDERKTAMIIGGTGLSKTLSVEKFCNKNPLYTYKITADDYYKLTDIIEELSAKTGVDGSSNVGVYNIKARINKIVEKLIDINGNGGKPIIIIDEAENLKMPALKAIKALYDKLNNHCAIVLVGTEELLNHFFPKRKSAGNKFPQLYRRFKAGRKFLTPILKERDFRPFFEKYVQDKGVRSLLTRECDNYGELHDYLEPALREADKRGLPLTEHFFRIKYNMPK